MEPRVLDNFLQWIKDTYATIGEVKTTWGKIHEYLGIMLDYSVPGKVSIDMIDYIQSMVNNFPQEHLKGVQVASPWSKNLFKVNDTSLRLTTEEVEQFHTSTAQGLFACKRGWPNIAPAIAYLTTWVWNPNQDDWMKLVQLMKFLKQTVKDWLTLQSDGARTYKWHVNNTVFQISKATPVVY